MSDENRDHQGTGSSVQEPVIEGALADDLTKHKGQWVAVLGDAIIASGATATEVKEAALERGVTDPLVFRVPLHPNRIAFF